MTPSLDMTPEHPGTGGVAEEVTCQQFVELITDYLEGQLPPHLHGLVEEHLVMCDWCVDYTEQMRTTVAQLASLRGVEKRASAPSEALLAVLRARQGGPA